MKQNIRSLIIFTALGLASFSSSYATESEQEQTSTPEVKNSKKTRQPKQTAKVVKQVDKRVEESCQTLQKLFPDTTMLPPALAKKVDKARNPCAFSDESIAKLVSTILALPQSQMQLTKEQVNGLQNVELVLQEKLSEYTITGFSLAIDPNLAFLVNHQNPSFNVTYKNADGETRYKKFDALIKSTGFKFEASLRIDLIIFVNTDLNFYDSSDTIELGMGIDFTLPVLTPLVILGREAHLSRRKTRNAIIGSLAFGLGFSYIPFKNMPGGMIMISIPVGFAFPNISLVYGGQLTPAE